MLYYLLPPIIFQVSGVWMFESDSACRVSSCNAFFVPVVMLRRPSAYWKDLRKSLNAQLIDISSCFKEIWGIKVGAIIADYILKLQVLILPSLLNEYLETDLGPISWSSWPVYVFCVLFQKTSTERNMWSGLPLRTSWCWNGFNTDCHTDPIASIQSHRHGYRRRKNSANLFLPLPWKVLKSEIARQLSRWPLSSARLRMTACLKLLICIYYSAPTLGWLNWVFGCDLLSCNLLFRSDQVCF